MDMSSRRYRWDAHLLNCTLTFKYATTNAHMHTPSDTVTHTTTTTISIHTHAHTRTHTDTHAHKHSHAMKHTITSSHMDKITHTGRNAQLDTHRHAHTRHTENIHTPWGVVSPHRERCTYTTHRSSSSRPSASCCSSLQPWWGRC